MGKSGKMAKFGKALENCGVNVILVRDRKGLTGRIAWVVGWRCMFSFLRCLKHTTCTLSFYSLNNQTDSLESAKIYNKTSFHPFRQNFRRPLKRSIL